jgi:hypothetical protein
MKAHDFFDRLSNHLATRRIPSLKKEDIIRQLGEALSLIEFRDGYYTHIMLDPKDRKQKFHYYDEMPVAVKDFIMQFLSLQRHAILDFIYELEKIGFQKIGSYFSYRGPTYIEKIKNDVMDPSSENNDENEQLWSSWLHANEVCYLLKTTQHVLQHYREKGVLSYSNIGTSYFYKVSDVREFLDRLESQSN